jgi:hypothetical protein
MVLARDGELSAACAMADDFTAKRRIGELTVSWTRTLRDIETINDERLPSPAPGSPEDT